MGQSFHIPLHSTSHLQLQRENVRSKNHILGSHSPPSRSHLPSHLGHRPARLPGKPLLGSRVLRLLLHKLGPDQKRIDHCPNQPLRGRDQVSSGPGGGHHCLQLPNNAVPQTRLGRRTLHPHSTLLQHHQVHPLPDHHRHVLHLQTQQRFARPMGGFCRDHDCLLLLLGSEDRLGPSHQ